MKVKLVTPWLAARFAAVLVFVFLLAGIAPAQSKPQYITLTPASNVVSSNIVSDLSKECSGVALTLDGTKADYLLEAIYDGGGAARRTMHFTLFSANGDAVFHTNTRNERNAIKDVCAFISKQERK
jgi:hypothetical protein